MIFIPGMRAAQRETRIQPLILQAANNDLNNLSTYTANSVAFGAAVPNRQIFISVMAQGAAQTLGSATIGGVAATILGQAAGSGGGGGTCAIIGANVPNGTTGTCVFNFTGTMQRMSFHVFRGEGFEVAPFSVVSTDVTLANPKALNVNAQNGGAIIASANILIASGSANASFLGVNFAQNTAVEAVQATLASGMQAGLVGQLARAVTITSTTGTLQLFQGIAVSLAPAA